MLISTIPSIYADLHRTRGSIPPIGSGSYPKATYIALSITPQLAILRVLLLVRCVKQTRKRKYLYNICWAVSNSTLQSLICQTTTNVVNQRSHVQSPRANVQICNRLRVVIERVE